MFAEFVAAHIPELIAALVLVPALVVHVALFFERTGAPRWGKGQTAADAARERRSAAPTVLPSRRGLPAGAGGLGLRRVSAAPHADE